MHLFGALKHFRQKGGSHLAKESGRVGLCLWAFGPPLFRLLRSYAFFLPKNDPLKFIGDLDVVWVPETRKYSKIGFSARAGLIPKKMGKM